MSDDSELDRALQNAILNLHDVKPKDPIRFLADYFACECEDDPSIAAVNLFDSLTIFHPITEERIIKCYDKLSSLDEFQSSLSGACYNLFIKQLVTRLRIPSELRKPILDYLDLGISSVISCGMLRYAILTVLLYRQYFEEICDVFDKLTFENDVAPAYRCEDLLIHASICLKGIHDTPREHPYTIGISTFCDPEYRISRSSSKDSVCEEFWDVSDFMMAAKETFFHEINDLSLSRFKLIDIMNYEYNKDKQGENKHDEYEFYKEECDEDGEDKHEDEEHEIDDYEKDKEHEEDEVREIDEAGKDKKKEDKCDIATPRT